MASLNIQKAHYEAIHDEYERHYYDATAIAYRERFIFRPALKGLALDGARIADLASGSGWNTSLMRKLLPNARFHGFDISDRACEAYVANTGFPATQCDLSAFRYEGEKFDAAVVIGGIHHMVNDLQAATSTISEMIKPGGYLIAYEPNADFFLNRVRNAWYKADRYFEDETERALGLDELQEHFAGKMRLLDSQALGGPAYIVILNSLILRVPLGVKRPLAGALFLGESAYNWLPGATPFPAFISRWRRDC